MRGWSLSLGLVAVCLMAGCAPAEREVVTPEPIATGAAICERFPGFCEEQCGKCEDPDACYASGGSCEAAAAVHYYDDRGDVNADVFTPGCHYIYGDAACTQSGGLFDVDSCVGDVFIVEWTQSACHGPTGDVASYDCDQECRRAGRGGGVCTWQANACGDRRSAYCECDQPLPPGPNPS